MYERVPATSSEITSESILRSLIEEVNNLAEKMYSLVFTFTR